MNTSDTFTGKVPLWPLGCPIKSDLCIIAKMRQSAQSGCPTIGTQWHLRCTGVAEMSNQGSRCLTGTIRHRTLLES